MTFAGRNVHGLSSVEIIMISVHGNARLQTGSHHCQLDFQPRISLHEQEQSEQGPGSQPLFLPEQRSRPVRGVHGQVQDHPQTGRHHRDHVGAQSVLPEHQGHVLLDVVAQSRTHTGHVGFRDRHTVFRTAVRLVSIYILVR